MQIGDTPKIICRETTDPQSLIADFDSGAWDQAGPAGALRLLRTDGGQSPGEPSLGTAVRCLWDREHLHVRFDCLCPTIWATRTRRDDELWTEPVVEVFLAPPRDAREYFEFQVNPLGTIYDAFVPDVSCNDRWREWCKWDCEGLEVAVRSDGGDDQAGWSAIFMIPLGPLEAQVGCRPAAGESWRANFCRYHYSEPSAQPELSCWAPTVSIFDDLPRFGHISFDG